MADSTHWVKYIESYVNSSSSPAQQSASLDAIAALLKNDILTMEALVREMEMYLTTTDSILRARGMLLLAELLTLLASKSLDAASITSLIGFFTERLADWKALRGALVGCLSLLKRKGNVGMVTINEARAVGLSYLQNLQVQSLGQHDRKLCFELLQCLLERYPDAVTTLGDDLMYGICEAIDGEKDPQCLMITFRIVEDLGRLFSDPSGPLGNFGGDIFEILGSYYPIHFTHPEGEDGDVKRDELSKALMLAFASTPVFEPFAIPLLLEKLSSSLPSAKVESLKYLSYCSIKYGNDRMSKHAEALWSSLKDAIHYSTEHISLLEMENLDGMGFQENQIATEAFALLQNLVQQNDDLFSSLVVNDEEINMTINSITNFKNHADIPMKSKKKLYAIGQMLFASARVSTASCNKVLQNFFHRLVESLGLSHLSGNDCTQDNFEFSEGLNYGALYLCVELLAACRYLVVGFEELSAIIMPAHETWCSMLQSFCHSLTETFCRTLVMSIDKSTQNAYICSGVKGLQILATFPGSFLPVPKSIFENILKRLMTIITLDFNNAFLWKKVLKVLVKIGSFIDNHNDADKATSFKDIVVEKIVSLIAYDDSTMPLSLKVQAISEIGTSGLEFMLRIAQGLEGAVFAKLSEADVDQNVKLAESAAELLGCFSNKVLPWFHKLGGFEEVPFHFAINIWDSIDQCMNLSAGPHGKELLSTLMAALKLAVTNCSEESQSIIIQKAINVLPSITSFPLNESMFDSIPTKPEVSKLNCSLTSSPHRDEWIISLFASVVIALRPQTQIPNVKLIVYMFMTTLLNGNVPAAQALGSIVNKLPLETNGKQTYNGCSLEEALDIIFNSSMWSADNYGLLRRCGTGDGSEIGLSGLRLNCENNTLVQTHTIIGLAWMGKGLLMRGHDKVKDITRAICSCLLLDNSTGALPLKQGLSIGNSEQDMLTLMRSAADAFNIIMSDSEACLNKTFHAIIRPLYKQRYFSTMMPILLSSVMKFDSSVTRSMLYRAFAHIISDTPLSAILSEAKKIIPVILDSLSILSDNFSNKDIVYSVLLVLSGILTDKNGQEAVIENAHIIVSRLVGLVSYPHMMLVRETAIQCLIAMSVLPHTRIYPMRTQVLRAITCALDDPKRAVRQEAVRCRQAWASVASRSLLF